MEHILGKREIYRAKKYFNRVCVEKFFHLADLGAVPFRNRRVFEPVRNALESLDSVVLAEVVKSNETVTLGNL